MAEKETFASQIYDFFASVKLALFVLIALAVGAVAGTIIPQNLQPEQYMQGYGPKLYLFLYYLDMFDMYNAWWFRLLVALLVANLIVCSFKRLPGTIRLSRMRESEKITPDSLKKQKFSRAVMLPGLPAKNLSQIREVFRSGFAAPKETTQNWGVLLSAHKGAFSRFGAYIVHLSLLFIVAGAVVGGVYGFNAFLTLNEGETASTVEGRKVHEHIELPFTLRLDRFVVEFYRTGAPSEFRSEVTVLENGKEIQKADIRVNHPLNYKGITFYQSSYGQAGGGRITLKYTNAKTGASGPVVLSPNRTESLPDGAGTVRMLDLRESLMNAGPAVRVVVTPKGGQAYAEWIFKKTPPEYPASDTDYKFTLENLQVQYYTGLQVAKDPGVVLIWIGCVMILAGFLIAFLFAHRKLFIGIVETGGRTQVLLAGSSHRNQGSFKIKFDALADRIQNAAAKTTEKR